MNPTPDWIVVLAPFASGAFGAGLTAGLFWGIVKQKISDHDRRLNEAEKKLDHQVGEARCDKMREECRSTILGGMGEIKAEIKSNRDYVVDRFTEIARFMGAHDGGD